MLYELQRIRDDVVAKERHDNAGQGTEAQQE
jgi:hypothetical protein